MAMAAPTSLRRWLVVLASMVAAVVGLGGSAGAQFGEVIHRYEVDIQIEQDGSMLVVERIAYDFGSQQRHGIFRDLRVRFTYDDRYDRVYPVEVLSVEGSPGTPDQYEVSEEDALLRIRIGDPDRTISGRHRYRITYRVEGALNGFADHDELYWNAIGHEWPVPTEDAEVRVASPAEIPDALCFAGPAGSTLPCERQEVDGDLATFGHASLNPFEGMTVVVAIPKGVITPPPQPVLDERWSLQRAFSATPVTVGVAGGLLLLLVGGALRMAWVVGRDRRIAGSPVDVAFGAKGVQRMPQQAVPLFEQGATPVEYTPPDGIRPGQVGTLLDEVAGPLDVTATIVDLAVRGYLRIEEIPKRWIFGKVDWRLIKLREADEGLLTYERMLLNNLFEEPDELEDEDEGSTTQPEGLARVRLSGLKKKFSERLHDVQEALYSDAAKRKWFAGRPDKVRERWSVRGWVLLLAGAGLTWLAAAKSHLGLLPIPIILAGLVLVWASSRMPRRTAKGTGLVRRVLGFRTYIETAEIEESRFAERANLFSQYLPYAIVFGLTQKWARAFADLDGQEDMTGGWYVGSRPFTADGFSSSMSSFAVSTSGTISSTPAGSGSSGFGGGGSSGGGGGGGGGGSW
jgi:uncharacterized membrane protein YgcG